MGRLREIEQVETGAEILIEVEPVSVVVEDANTPTPQKRGHAQIHYIGYHKDAGVVTLQILIVSSTAAEYLFREVDLPSGTNDWYYADPIRIPPDCKLKVVTTGIGANAHRALVVAEG